MTRPKGVTRKKALRLLKLCASQKRMPKHIAVLLSLYKSYKPEFVREGIAAAINVQSAWCPFPELLRIGLGNARNRIKLNDDEVQDQQEITWHVFDMKRRKIKPLIPSMEYFNAGSTLSSNIITKTIHDVIHE